MAGTNLKRMLRNPDTRQEWDNLDDDASTTELEKFLEKGDEHLIKPSDVQLFFLFMPLTLMVVLSITSVVDSHDTFSTNFLYFPSLSGPQYEN